MALFYYNDVREAEASPKRQSRWTAYAVESRYWRKSRFPVGEKASGFEAALRKCWWREPRSIGRRYRFHTELRASLKSKVGDYGWWNFSN